jgi:hypothetical protein
MASKAIAPPACVVESSTPQVRFVITCSGSAPASCGEKGAFADYAWCPGCLPPRRFPGSQAVKLRDPCSGGSTPTLVAGRPDPFLGRLRLVWRAARASDLRAQRAYAGPDSPACAGTPVAVRRHRCLTVARAVTGPSTRCGGAAPYVGVNTVGLMVSPTSEVRTGRDLLNETLSAQPDQLRADSSRAAQLTRPPALPGCRRRRTARRSS